MKIDNWFTAIVVDLADPLQAGRAKIRCYEYHEIGENSELKDADLPWAMPVMPLTSASSGGVGTSATGLKEGSWVLGFFRDTDLQDPIIIGSIPSIQEAQSAESQAAANAASNSQSSSGSGSSTPFTGSQQEYYTKVYNAVYAAAVAQGLPNPEVIARLGAAQSSLETGYGKSMPSGSNNAFGIKGTGSAGSVNSSTREVINGQSVYINDNFRAYSSIEESASDYVSLLNSKSRYASVVSATNIDDAASALGKSGYATDPSYGSTVASIAKKY
jgi:hypothetical protein